MGAKLYLGNGQATPSVVVEKQVRYVGKYNVRVVDFDGTIVKQEYLNTGDVFTLPAAPTHSGLVFDGWISPLTISNNQITVQDDDVTIGTTYVTESGLTEIDITIPSDNFTITCQQISGTRNWGDGTSDSNTTHTYEQAGDYTLSFDVNKVPQSMFSGSNSGLILRNFRSGTNLRELTLQTYSGYHTVVTKNTMNSFWVDNTYAPHISVPKGCYGEFSCACHYVARSIAIPNSGSYTKFANGNKDCFCLENLQLPNNITNLKNCTSLFGVKRLKIPNKVNTIEAYAFTDTPLEELDFSTFTSVPTLKGVLANFDIYTTKIKAFNPKFKIKVPANLYDSWIVANNWSQYAKYIEAV